MASFRIHKNNDYTVINNSVFKNRSLTWKAKGLLATMLSLPDDWDYSVNGLAALSNGGRDQVIKILDELEAAGYLDMVKTRNSKGQYITSYDVYEDPSRKTRLGKSDSENPQQYNTNNKVLKNTVVKEIQKESTLFDGQVVEAEVVDEFSFEAFWSSYNLKKDIKAAKRAWAKLTKAEKKAAIEYIGMYDADCAICNRPKRYPATYLNQGTWNNELAKFNPGSSQTINPILDVANRAEYMYQQMRGNLL